MTAGSFAELLGRLALYALACGALLVVAGMIERGGRARRLALVGLAVVAVGAARRPRGPPRAGPSRAPVRLRLDPGGRRRGGRRPPLAASPRSGASGPRPHRPSCCSPRSWWSSPRAPTPCSSRTRRCRSRPRTRSPSRPSSSHGFTTGSSASSPAAAPHRRRLARLPRPGGRRPRGVRRARSTRSGSPGRAAPCPSVRAGRVVPGGPGHHPPRDRPGRPGAARPPAHLALHPHRPHRPAPADLAASGLAAGRAGRARGDPPTRRVGCRPRRDQHTTPDRVRPGRIRRHLRPHDPGLARPRLRSRRDHSETTGETTVALDVWQRRTS